MRLRHLELRHFRYFIAVAEELSFTKAARRLHISQPPLSQHVQEIERELGTQLLDRNRSHVALTEAGRLFLDEARSVIQQASHAVDTARRAGRGELGVLRIGFTATAPFASVFSAAIRAYRREWPEVRLILENSMTGPVVESLQAGTLDVGFVRPPISAVFPQEIVTLPIVTDRLMVVLNADHPLAAADGPIPIEWLAKEPFILRGVGANTGYYEQIYQCCVEAGFFPQVIQEAKEAATILGLVSAGLGITILPASLSAIAVSGVVWRRLQTRSEATSQMLLIYERENDSPQQAEFTRLVQSLVRDGHCCDASPAATDLGDRRTWSTESQENAGRRTA